MRPESAEAFRDAAAISISMAAISTRKAGGSGAGIGGVWTTKQDINGINAASDIVISGGRVSARGQYNAAGIGGGRWCHGKNITITDATLNLSSLYHFTNSSASAIGFGDLVYNTEELVTDPSIATNDQIRIAHTRESW